MKQHLNTIFLVILLILVGLLTYRVVEPFLVAIFLAFVLSQLFKGWYQWFTQAIKKHPGTSALLTCLSILVVLVVPTVIVISLVITEINALYQGLEKNSIIQMLQNISQLPIFQKLGLNPFQTFLNQPEQLADDIQKIGNVFFQIVKQTYQGATHFIFMTFVMFFTLYYFFKDGDHFMKKIAAFTPLKNNQERILLDRFIAISRATLKGSLVIALVQGTLVGGALFIAGVPSAVLWGLVAVFFSLIPMIGTAVIWVPAGIILILTGNIWQGFFILLSGALLISTIDNFLRPKLVGDETSLHPLLVFFSSLGGIFAFGLSGFLLGPVVMVLFTTLLDLYQAEFKKELNRFNRH